MGSIQASTFLRRILWVDALSSGAMGLAMLLASDALAAVLQLPVQLLSGAGIVLLPFAAYVAFLASRTHLSPLAVWSVIGLNVLWVIESVLLLMSNWVAPNALGAAFVVAQAVAVASFAQLEYLGLRRSPAAAR